jgi:hypothetical protein
VSARRTLRFIATLSLAVLAAAAACSSSGPATFHAGVSAQRPINALDDDEVRRVCQRAEDYFVATFEVGDLERMTCVFGALTALFAGTADDCDAYVRDCLVDPPLVVELVSPGSFRCGTIIAAELEECASSIGALETCLNEQGDGFRAFADAFDCRLASNPSWQDDFDAAIAGLRAGCADLDPVCPFAPDVGPTPP